MTETVWKEAPPVIESHVDSSDSQVLAPTAEAPTVPLITDNAAEVPPDAIPIPARAISYSQAGEIIFEAITKKGTMFSREGVVHEVQSMETDVLSPVTPERFVSALEKLGKRIVRHERKEIDGKIVFSWRQCPFPTSSAKVILVSDEARALPPIRQLANCAILTPEGDVLARGYHHFRGGTFISQGTAPPIVPLERAVSALLDLLTDFDFTTEADKSRAVASLISPAMKMGGHIIDDFPLDLAEADVSQSGKTYRQKLVAALYQETPAAVLQPKGGVGSLDEAISACLIQGRPFIAIDNFRGKLDSSILESAIRGHGRVTARALRTSAEVCTAPFLWQISTNGAELTRDLANRSIITRIRKRPAGYRFKDYLEGDALAHVKARHAAYLGAIFAIVRAWLEAGRPITGESRHDFRGWVRPMDWIVQNIFRLPPLLDGHREEQARTANPRLQWLRDVCHAAAGSRMTGRELSTTELCTLAADAGIDFPGNPNSREEPSQRAGKILGLIFRETDGQTVLVDGFEVSRREFKEWNDKGEKTIRHYVISPVPPSPPLGG